MNGIIEPKTEKYVYSLLPARDRVQRDQERYAAQYRVPIIGPACGRLLYQLARLIQARRVFEMGSAIGYSTIWLARAVGPKGTDLRRARLLDRVRVLVGDAVRLLESTEGQFDLIFNDVNKTQYPEVFRKAVARVRLGGLFITDNVLWSGRVARKPAANDADTRAIQRFNRLVFTSPKIFPTIVPLRDGFAVCEKIKA